MANPKIIAAAVVLVIGLVITIGVVGSAITSGDNSKEKMVIENYSPPPPPSPAFPPPLAPTRRLSTRSDKVSTHFELTEAENRSISAEFAAARDAKR